MTCPLKLDHCLSESALKRSPDFFRRLIAKRAVWSVPIVLVAPLGQFLLSVRHPQEQALVEELVAELSVEALDKRVLDRLARRDQTLLNTALDCAAR